ncbi:MAG: response regulator transcription factor [Anaerolineae bacterium]|jgi:two-component system KDP operon response regulator KdpE
MPENILIIDDHEPILKLISKLLETEGYSIFTAQSGDEGLALFHQTAPDLVILDIMMPGMDGWEVCRRLRKTSCVPIIFLTALGSEKDVVAGLLSGADDYLTKPIRKDELRARVAAILRRARMPHEQPDILRFGNGDLIIDRKEQAVFAHNREMQLSPIEYNLLLLLADRAGRIISTQALTDAIWGPNASEGSKGLKWYIWRLRQKIEADPQEPCYILTERGKGYRFSPH